MPARSMAIRRTVLVAAGAAMTVAGAARAQGRGTLVVVNRSDATVNLVDVASGSLVTTLPTGTGPHEVAVSPDGRWAVVTEFGADNAPGSTLSVVDVARGRLSESIHLGTHRRPHGVAWLPDGQHVVVTTQQDSSLLIVNVPTGRVEAAIPTGQAISNMVAVSQDGGRAYVANIGSGSVTMVDLRTRRAVWTTVVAEGAEGIAVTPDGSQVWVTSRPANRISVLSAAGLDTLATFESGELPIRVRFTPDGRLAAVTFARSSELKLFDTKTRAQVASIKMKVDRAAQRGEHGARGYEGNVVPIGLAIAPDGKTAFVAEAGADIVTVVNLGKHNIAGYLPSGREPEGIAFSPLEVSAPR